MSMRRAWWLIAAAVCAIVGVNYEIWMFGYAGAHRWGLQAAFNAAVWPMVAAIGLGAWLAFRGMTDA